MQLINPHRMQSGFGALCARLREAMWSSSTRINARTKTLRDAIKKKYTALAQAALALLYARAKPDPSSFYTSDRESDILSLLGRNPINTREHADTHIGLNCCVR